MSFYKVSPCSRKDLRSFARYFRKCLKLDNALDFPILEVFETMASEGYFDYEIVEKEAMSKNYGETVSNKNLIRIREDIYDMVCNDVPFGRSTIAHEMFHKFKHCDEEIVFFRSVEEIKNRKTYEDPEWQANCFAGELLVPKHLVKGMTIEEVMSKCKVSREWQASNFAIMKKKVGTTKKAIEWGLKG